MHISLIQPPTLALRIHGIFDEPSFLGPVYSRIMPASQLRVAGILRERLPDYGTNADITIHDMRINEPDRIEKYGEICWEDQKIELMQVGSPFNSIDDLVENSDIIGITSHFRNESGIVGNLIRYIKDKCPTKIVIVGGADTKHQPERYLAFGADFVMCGDLNIELFVMILKKEISPQKVLLQNEEGNNNNNNNTLTINNMPPPALDLLPDIALYTDTHDGPLLPQIKAPVGFIYFSRGCPYECNFCDTRLTKNEPMDFKTAVRHIAQFEKYGVKTLDIVDDNLLQQLNTPSGRENILDIFRYLRARGFCWEFPNGLVVSKLLNDGKVDNEIIDALFKPEYLANSAVGGWSLYFPIEKVLEADRINLRKLKSLAEQDKVIGSLARQRLLRIAFGIVLSTDISPQEQDAIINHYREIRRIVNAESNGFTRVRCGVFHPIPIAELQKHPLAYDFPEGYTFYLPIMQGSPCSVQLRKRLDITEKIDIENYKAMQLGKYAYS